MDGIVSLRFGHTLLSDLCKLKKSYLKIHTVIEKEKDKLLKIENQAVTRNERLRVLRSIHAQPITYYKLNSNFKVNQKDSFDFTTTRDYILNSKCLLYILVLLTMQNYVYDAKFVENILIVGRTGCGKTYFTQKLAVNGFFDCLKKVEWVSYIELKRKEWLKLNLVFHVMLSFTTQKD